jgi:hypothetical protein
MEDEDCQSLLAIVTGLGSEPQLTQDDFDEADRIIEDPNLPCSDLRGRRDMPEYADENWRQEIL